MNKNLNEIIDRIAAIKTEQNALTAEYEALIAGIEADAAQKLADTKNKSVRYASDSGSSLLFTRTETISITDGSLLEEIFGKPGTMYRTELKYSLGTPAKEIIRAVIGGEYCEGSISEIVRSLPCDDGIKKILAGKLTGTDFEKDKSVLMHTAGLSETDATDAAWLISEAAAWENLCRFAGSQECTPAFVEALREKLNHAVKLRSGTRVSILTPGSHAGV